MSDKRDSEEQFKRITNNNEEEYPAKIKRVYRFDLRDIVAGTIAFISKGEDVSNASNKLADELDEDVSNILSTLEASYIWNPIAKQWVPNRPWWEEEKELYEWEK